MTVVLYEAGNTHRQIYTDGRGLPKEYDKPAYFGYSVGHWEGDTLVVDTIAFNDRTRIDEEGIVHSVKLHMVERLRKIDNGNAIENLMTIEDPAYFTAPWQARRTYIWRPDIRLSEYICEENNRNEPNAQGITTAK
jgi:hypothetical protein